MTTAFVMALALDYMCSTRSDNCQEVENLIRLDAISCETAVDKVGLAVENPVAIGDAYLLSAILQPGATEEHVACINERHAARQKQQKTKQGE